MSDDPLPTTTEERYLSLILVEQRKTNELLEQIAASKPGEILGEPAQSQKKRH